MDKFLRPERFDADSSIPDSKSKWLHWYKTLSNFIDSLEQEEEDINKLDILINHVSPRIYEHISEAVSYGDAIRKLQGIFVKPQNEVMARHQLATRRQRPCETIDQYLQNLRLLAKECNFQVASAEKYREESIRDAFISGLSSPAMRQRLLENRTLTLHDAVAQALSLESAQKSASLFSHLDPSMQPQPLAAAGAELPDPCNDETPNVVALTRKKCYFCGEAFHQRYKCPAKDVTCRKCGKFGHYSKVCRASKNREATLNSLCTTSNAATALTDLSKSVIDVHIQGRTCKALLDSGSTLNFISKQAATSLRLKISPNNRKITMASASLQTELEGHCYCDLFYNKEKYESIKLHVMDNLCCEIILGHEFMAEHQSLQINFNGQRPSLVCSLQAMNITPPRLFTNLAPIPKPVCAPSRKFPPANQKFIKEEVIRLQREGIIEQSNSPWRAQVLVTSNERHKRRMVVDYSSTINRYTYLDAFPLPNINELAEKVAQFKYFSRLDLKSAYHQIPLHPEERIYTAFEADKQLFQFCRLPFGLTNAVAVFQRVMQRFIETYQLQGTFAYIDDVIVCGNDQEEHDRNLEKLMNAMKDQGFTINEEKCEFNKTGINFLGFNISNGTLRPDPDRLQPLRDLPEPQTKEALKRAIGLFSYYSSWLPKFSDKIQPLLSVTKFPMGQPASISFKLLKEDILNGVISAVDPAKPLTVETDASDFALSATLTQDGKPVAFFSKSLSNSERYLPIIEKEAAAIVESVRKWRHYLLGKHFTLITDQEAVSFMLNQKHRTKIKNDKILRWRVELSAFSYDVRFRPGKENAAADALSRSPCASMSSSLSLETIHRYMCHPGITRLLHFVRSKNLPFSTEEVRRVCNNCRDCANLKPKFYRPSTAHIIKATQPFERLSLDFVGPKESTSRNKYLLVIIDEFSRFPFAFPTKDMTSETVKSCLTNLFSVFGLPSSVHSDRGTQFMSNDLRNFLVAQGISQTRTSPYNPKGNGQCERENATIWKAIQLALKTRGLPESQWELVLPDALGSIRSLLCTATNCTPHERIFKYSRRSASGKALPTWLMHPGPVLLRRHIRNKSDPLGDEVMLQEANPNYASVKFPDGRETTVSLRDIAPLPKFEHDPEIYQSTRSPCPGEDTGDVSDGACEIPEQNESGEVGSSPETPTPTVPRRSTRVSKMPERLTYF